MLRRPAAAAAPGVRRAHLVRDGSLIGGVATGLAEHLRIPVLWVRIAFVLAATVNGFGVVVYLGLWLLLPSQRAVEGAPGIDAATRQGRRAGPSRTLSDYGMLVAFGALAVGGLLLVTGATGTTLTVWPILLGLTGAAVLWGRSDDEHQRRWLDSEGPGGSPRQLILGAGGWPSYARVLAGLALLVIAVLTFVVRSGGWSAALNVAIAALLGVIGIGFIAGPWLLRLSRDLTEERAARVRAQERADVAAHLHDSVLQTLALIQKSANDPGTVAKLARAQERDLRTWLFETPVSTTDSLVAALRETAAEIEDGLGVPIEVVAVGDRDVPEEMRPVVAAAREAMANAARHSGAAKIDVYVEVEGQAVEVFVRDRGRGFDLDDVPGDRAGVRNSIIGRMERHGGQARVRSTPGSGTEITLQWKPREAS